MLFDGKKRRKIFFCFFFVFVLFSFFQRKPDKKKKAKKKKSKKYHSENPFPSPQTNPSIIFPHSSPPSFPDPSSPLFTIRSFPFCDFFEGLAHQKALLGRKKNGQFISTPRFYEWLGRKEFGENA